MLKTTERIITTEMLGRETATAVQNAQQEPLVITEAGQPAAYFISVALYDSLMAHLQQLEQSELLAGIEIGEQQFSQGQFKTLEEAAQLAEARWQTTIF